MKKYIVLGVLLLVAVFFVLVFSVPENGNDVALKYSGHVDVYMRKSADEPWVQTTSAKNVLTEIGADMIAWQLSGNPVAGNASKYVALSFDTSPQASWTKLPNELNNNSLGRATGTFQWNGTGKWNITADWTATGTQNDVQCTGLHWSATPESDDNLFAAVAIGPDNLLSGYQYRVIWSIEASE